MRDADGGWWRSTQVAVGLAIHLLSTLAWQTRFLAGDGGWWDKHKIWIGESNPPGVDASYSELLASSVFFFSLMGDGFSSRYDDAIIHGCGGWKGWCLDTVGVRQLAGVKRQLAGAGVLAGGSCSFSWLSAARCAVHRWSPLQKNPPRPAGAAASL